VVSGKNKRPKVVSNQYGEEKGLLDGSTGVTDRVVIVGSLGTQCPFSSVLKGPVGMQW